MNHHTAAQRGTDGWHYVSLNRRTGGYPIGYCAEHEPHATAQKARECYAQYRRDNIRLEKGNWSWSGCEVDGCDNPSKNAATFGSYGHATLCDEHLTVEHAIDALGLRGPAGDSWQS